jgi:hypothetical protein
MTLADLIRDLLAQGVWAYNTSAIPAHIRTLIARGLLDVTPELPEQWQPWQSIRGWGVMKPGGEVVEASAYQCRAADWSALMEPLPTVFPGDEEDAAAEAAAAEAAEAEVIPPEPEPAPMSRKEMRKKIDDDNAAALIAAVEGYQAAHDNCSQRAALIALYGLKRYPSKKVALSRARKRL